MKRSLISLSPKPGEKLSSFNFIALLIFDCRTLNLRGLFLYYSLIELSSFLHNENKNASSHSR
jgi:hypothetical protein